MKSAAIRTAFLKFFETHGHQRVPSAPIIPQNDPTLMFVNAGMVPFKDVFTGKDTRPYKRATSSQKCIRISGKHNDLENVGVTARHHTFFEMLGNFSFGDYFKEQAIVLAWQLLTEVFNIPKERLVITVFKGAGDFVADEEAIALWRKVSGFGEDRILQLGMADNFWSMGPTGPCGPCTEIHYFHGAKPDVSTFGQEPDMSGQGWTEIWNLVFMQYDRAHEGAAPTLLPAPSIDTGAGLERLAGVVQGVTSNYHTDIFQRLLNCIADIAKKPYGASGGDDDISMRVVADHARTTAFLMAEGVMPDKQRRQYVLRRVMRRAIRHGHRLGIERPFLHRVAAEVVAAMGDTYPELVERRALIARVTEGEEERFRATLKRGMRILDERFDDMRGRGEKQLSAAVAADLYTTYGFPLDLTEVISREQSLSVDLVGARAIVEGGEKADGPIDPSAAVDPIYRQLARQLAATDFTGYDREEGEAKVLALVLIDDSAGLPKRRLVQQISAHADVEVVLDSTPFYAESGGQVGDSGRLGADGVVVEVVDTYRRFDQLTLHRGSLLKGSLLVGDSLTATVDPQRRSATRRNHSATHLLHWALKHVLGAHAQQKGSLVGPEVLRFDFAHNQPLSQAEITQVENLVNDKVLSNAAVTTQVLPIEEARAAGAVAIFEEKYGDVVRVLTMTDDSVELCGGTHCSALGDIGLFKIVSEGGTAAGVRRIMAASGHNALAWVRAMQWEMARARDVAKAHGGDLAEKIGKILKEGKRLEKRIKVLEKQLLEGTGDGGGGLASMLAKTVQVADVAVLAVRVADGTNMGNLRELAEKLRDKLGERAVVLAACANGPKAQLALMVSKALSKHLAAGKLIKPIAQHVGGSGGGRPDMAQAGGTEVAGIDDALAALVGEVRAALG